MYNMSYEKGDCCWNLLVALNIHVLWSKGCLCRHVACRHLCKSNAVSFSVFLVVCTNKFSFYLG